MLTGQKARPRAPTCAWYLLADEVLRDPIYPARQQQIVP
jgi:hypothetical protein